MWDPDRFARALDFAATAHGEQRVPGSTRPYVVHLVKVAQEVMVAAVADPALDADVVVQSALLHDCMEDAGVTASALEAAFGQTVRRCVEALTKDRSLPKAEQMPDSLVRLGAAPREARVVKLGDRITNLEDPPPAWTPQKCVAYREEARQILASLGHESALLARRLELRIERYADFIAARESTVTASR